MDRRETDIDGRSSAEQAFGARSESRVALLARMVQVRYAVGVATVAGLALIAAGSAKAGAMLMSVVGMVGFAVNAQHAYRTDPEHWREKVHPAAFYAAVAIAVALVVATVVARTSR